MKILICSISNALGGMERRIEAETNLLTRLGHHVYVATSHFAKLAEWKRDIKAAGGEYIYWRPYKFIERQHLAAPFQWLARLGIPMLRYYHIDFAHIPLPWNFFGISLAYVLSAARVPFIFSVHGTFDSKILPGKSLPYAKQALRSLRGVYAVSAPARDAFIRLYQDLLPSSTPIEVIHNGINTERFRPDAETRQAHRHRLGFTEDQFVVMFCGRLDTLKRPTFALSIFSDFLTKYPQARFLIVGDGPEMATLKSRIDVLNLQDIVKLTGQVADTAPYYRLSDCYISTSGQLEGCPLATAEALASGVPAVVPDDEVFSSIYGAAEAVQRCDPTNPSTWCQALLSFAKLDTTAKQALNRSAQTFANTYLSEEVMYRKLAQFYEKAFSRPNEVCISASLVD